MRWKAQKKSVPGTGNDHPGAVKSHGEDEGKILRLEQEMDQAPGQEHGTGMESSRRQEDWGNIFWREREGASVSQDRRKIKKERKRIL